MSQCTESDFVPSIVKYYYIKFGGKISMRKVYLRMNENEKYEIIKKLVETSGNKNTAARKLGTTTRTVNRLIEKYKEKGKEGFVHGNRGRVPDIAFSIEIKELILDLYNTKYHGANFKHFSLLLKKDESISISPRTLNSWLLEENILSPKARRITKSKLKKRIKAQSKTKSSKEKNELLEIIEVLDINDAHPRRPRCAYMGEMIQMDASSFKWFNNITTHLHVAIDDASGFIVGAYFDDQETLKGYHNVYFQILNVYGIPYMFYTDRRTVFEYIRKKAPSTQEDTFTQFSYACKQLGTEIITTSIPEAKGRVERLNQTLQSRLPIELRINGITSIEEANKFLTSTYINEFNNEFGLCINSTKSVFEKQPSKEKINSTLAILSPRVVDNGHSIRFKNTYYSIRTQLGQALFYPKGTKGLVVKTFDGTLLITIGERVHALEPIPDFESHSRNFESEHPNPDISEKKMNIPSMIHPWRIGSFNAFLLKQQHRNQT